MSIAFFSADRHYTAGKAQQQHLPKNEWRMRMKTTAVQMVMCLNVGIDPPDVVKTSPCARDECWMDPRPLHAARQVDKIPRELQKQYERWQARVMQAQYKAVLDPTADEVQRMCLQTRRYAGEDRVVFHYNGHGVPRPTSRQEIWVFNQNYTQYIPVLMKDVMSWLKTPTVYVLDCSDAGTLLESFLPKEVALLPMNPSMPSDVFTSCLTTPSGSPSDGGQVPGLPDQPAHAPGELNWIFTAITDTIAWNTCPPAPRLCLRHGGACPTDLFQKLFRQDLLLAALFRHFLLAERIMRTANCTP
ncbi:putative Regulatory-associated protein of mTOR [Paratrimastix pyriformis]|uniref:Regulatory-associated protein of mTOR n=1 Tax=Paratrimastix pyriformis TaxID=342808 RepID=A0ABQ8V0Q0_9EUKA|nr:putative Regulatory-associated protein of mTOR [Paratrimastix pyriformis]